KKAVPPPEKRPMPMTFVEVDPAQAAVEPPQETSFYSTLNTLAANPDPRLDTPIPKFEGTQEKMVRTMDNLKPQPHPLQASPPKENPPPEPIEAQPKPAASEPKGDLVLAKASPITLRQDDKNDESKEREPAKPTRVRP